MRKAAIRSESGNHESSEWDERDARQSRLGSGDETGMFHRESMSVFFPDFLIKFL
jgi:hypothetical protein